LIFISYSRNDSNIVLPLVKLLKASGHDVFLDIDNLDYGGDWRSQLSTAILKSERFLIFWSKSCKVSEVIQEEWKQALTKPQFKIIPVKLDKTPLPLELATFHGTGEMAPVFTALKRVKSYRLNFLTSLIVIAIGIAFFVKFYFFKGASKAVYHAEGAEDFFIANLLLLIIPGIIIFLLLAITLLKPYYKGTQIRKGLLYRKALSIVLSK
jgi:hypothetical protein